MPGTKATTLRTRKVRSYSFRVVLRKDDDVYLATVPALPGCHSWGYTVEEALRNVQDAIETYIEDLKKHHEPIPTEPATDVIVFSEPRVTVTV
jgi:antitoxin HicB